MLAMKNLGLFSLLTLAIFAAAVLAFGSNQILQAADNIIAAPAIAKPARWSLGCGNSADERKATQSVTELTVRNGTTRFTNAQGRRVVTTLPCQATTA